MSSLIPKQNMSLGRNKPEILTRGIPGAPTAVVTQQSTGRLRRTTRGHPTMVMCGVT